MTRGKLYRAKVPPEGCRKISSRVRDPVLDWGFDVAQVDSGLYAPEEAHPAAQALDAVLVASFRERFMTNGIAVEIPVEYADVAIEVVMERCTLEFRSLAQKTGWKVVTSSDGQVDEPDE